MCHARTSRRFGLANCLGVGDIRGTRGADRGRRGEEGRKRVKRRVVSVSRTARKLSVLPSRDDELVRRRIDVDGGRDPTDGTILRMASPWHSNVPSGKTYRGAPRRRRIVERFSSFRCFFPLMTTGPIDLAFDP